MGQTQSVPVKPTGNSFTEAPMPGAFSFGETHVMHHASQDDIHRRRGIARPTGPRRPARYENGALTLRNVFIQPTGGGPPDGRRSCIRMNVADSQCCELTKSLMNTSRTAVSAHPCRCRRSI